MGQRVTFDVASGAPGDTLHLLVGRPGGSVTVPGCDGVAVALSSPDVLASDLVVPRDGSASRSFRVPSAVAGRTYTFQAASAARCEVSAPLTLTTR